MAFKRKVEEPIEVPTETAVVSDAIGVELAASTQDLVPFLDLRHDNIDQSVLPLIPESLARECVIMPVRFVTDCLLIAAVEPTEKLRTMLSAAVGHPVRLVPATESDIGWAINNNYKAVASVESLTKAFEALEATRKPSTSSSNADTGSVTAPIIQLVDTILTQAFRDRASDVHIEPTSSYVRVRFRIDGVLKEILQLKPSMGPGLVSRIKIMAAMNIVERRLPQDGHLTTTIDGVAVDVRVATVKTVFGEQCVLRILDKGRSVLRLDQLGMPKATHDVYSKLVHAPFGMVLCAGPTGSGKTTTLYATLNEVSSPGINIMTIEDPVEYIFPEINQIQTNEQTGLTFANGLKSILRQDPDVILVGEVRDADTTRVAVQSALTGHFVLSSMHSTDTVSALHRFLDMGIESFLVSSSVLGVLAQRLLRRICPSCKDVYTPTREELLMYTESGAPEKEVFYHGVGCNFCSLTGFKERIGIFELLVLSPEIRQLLVDKATLPEMQKMAVDQGMGTLHQEAIRLVTQDITTLDEVIRSVYAI
jgi:type IV pilus assembly protein PilB